MSNSYQVLYSTSLGYALYQNKEVTFHKTLGKLSYKGDKLLIGDYVLVDNRGMIYKILDRETALSRPRLANCSLVLILISAKEPLFSSYLLDKFLSLVNFSNIKAAIIITKTDLLNEEELKQLKIRLLYYEKISYPVFFIDNYSKDKYDFEKLDTFIENKKVALMGQTGVGKSSLLNLLSPELKRKVDSLHVVSGRGRHTTKEVIMLPYKEGFIYDTPGFSELNLLEMKPKDLAIYFPGFQTRFSLCKFNDCSHLGREKDCKIIDDVKNDVLALDSYKNYCKIYEEVKQNDIWKKKL